MNVVQRLVTVYWGALIKIRDKSLGGGQSSNQNVWLPSWMTLIPPLSLVNASILLLHIEACWPVRDVRQEAHVLHVRCLTSSYAAVVTSSRWSLLQPRCRRISQKLCVFVLEVAQNWGLTSPTPEILMFFVLFCYVLMMTVSDVTLCPIHRKLHFSHYITLI